MWRVFPALACQLRVSSPFSASAAWAAVGSRSYSTDLAIRGLDAVAAGKGGRSSVSGITATVFGCSGFLGRYVSQALGRLGVQLVFPYRVDDTDVQHLWTMGDLGSIATLGGFDIRDEDQISRAIAKSNVVINLIGADQETWNYGFEEVHVDIPRRIAKAVKENGGVQRFIHVSALGASPDAPSKRLRTKAAGEEVMRSELGDIATIFKLAHLTGNEDRLFNNYAKLAKALPFIPLINGGATRLQPVWVRDVTSGITESLKRWEALGKTYHLAGPDVYTVRQLVEFMYTTIREQPTILNVPAPLARLAVRPLDALRRRSPLRPNFMFSGDQVEELLGADFTLPSDPSLLTFADLGIIPHRVTEGLPIEYLRFYRSGGYDFGTTAEGSSAGSIAGGLAPAK